MKIIDTKYGKVITYSIELSAYIPKNIDPSTLTEEWALKFCKEHLCRLAESNSGSEIFEVQLDEYKTRYKREHDAAQYLGWFKNNLHLLESPEGELTPFARCFSGFKEELDKTEPDAHLAYQKFYILDKMDFAKWPSIEKIPCFWPEKSARFVDKSFVNGVYSKR